MKFPPLILIFAILTAACGSTNRVAPRISIESPMKIVWAWERPEDLRFFDPKTIGVAFLAQTILLEGDEVSLKNRRQPLEVAPGTYLIAVTRIETSKESEKRPLFDLEMIRKVTKAIRSTLDLPDVRSIQVDFDAVVSERSAYRSLMVELRQQLPAEIPLTMTSLASWCSGDSWFNDFPIDEAVPMVFNMGADEDKIKAYLRNGNDWSEPLCRGSYGISLNESQNYELKPDRRVYYFKNGSWNRSDLMRLK